MKQLLIIGLILGLTNCSVGQQKLANDKTIKKSFSESELQDLQLLYDFFNQTICDSDQELENCYDDFFKKVKLAADSGSMYLHIPFENQKAIYNEFQDSTFYQIWAFGKTWTRENPNDTLREVYYRWDGKFMDFLRRAGKKDEFINAYHESVEAAGGPPPSLIAGIIINYDKLNIEDPKVKFVIAIHYLTLNDQYKRKEKK
ncbi:MAG: hypothetical protein CMC96_08595 [Flavobacteriales bacterium]|nr:hypothetical protein [Flavobacteriales bacterium]|tara:strand:- start:823 stop:1425 length:603 start_codon:yes stop_codon:yes gene_type:complete